MTTLDDVARMASELPDVVEGERHGTRTWSVAGKGFAWERQFSKADLRRFGEAPPPEEPILAVRVSDLDDKDVLLAADQEGFFTIPHFDGYAAVLIELRLASPTDVQEAVVDAWLACAPRGLAEEYLERERSSER